MRPPSAGQLVTKLEFEFVLRLLAPEKVKIHVDGGSQQAASGAGCPILGPRHLCAWAQLGSVCSLLQNGGWNRDKDSYDKHDQHWLTLVDKLDTPTTMGFWKGTLKQHAQKPLSLACLVRPVRVCAR